MVDDGFFARRYKQDAQVIDPSDMVDQLKTAAACRQAGLEWSDDEVARCTGTPSPA